MEIELTLGELIITDQSQAHQIVLPIDRCVLLRDYESMTQIYSR